RVRRGAVLADEGVRPVRVGLRRDGHVSRLGIHAGDQVDVPRRPLDPVENLIDAARYRVRQHVVVHAPALACLRRRLGRVRQVGDVPRGQARQLVEEEAARGARGGRRAGREPRGRLVGAEQEGYEPLPAVQPGARQDGVQLGGGRGPRREVVGHGEVVVPAQLDGDAGVARVRARHPRVAPDHDAGRHGGGLVVHGDGAQHRVVPLRRYGVQIKGSSRAPS
ncbi:MAG: hypothetical protein Q6373_004220, partial [Candidatus Sigynarchaeota archaeon]